MALIPKTDMEGIAAIAAALGFVSTDSPAFIARQLVAAIKPARAIWSRAVAACNYPRNETKDAKANARDFSKVREALAGLAIHPGAMVSISEGGDCRAPMVRIAVTDRNGHHLLTGWSNNVGLY